jgi:glycosyltransferase involved in cell wall biosynthesis
MKIIHLLAGPLASGAGRAVETLQHGLLSRGVQSSLAGRIEKDLDPKLAATPLSIADRVATGLIHRAQLHINLLRFRGREQLGFLQWGSDFTVIPAFRNADIIHVQWASAITMGTRFWRNLAKEHRPVVWTLRDMWPFTGGCHFSNECTKYETGCGGCPKLGKSDERATAREAEYKRSMLPENVTFIAISEHFAEKARRSYVLRGRNVQMIPNSVDIERIAQPAEGNVYAALRLPQNRLVLSSGAINLADPRKGAAVLERLLIRYARRSDIFWAIFGRGFQNLSIGEVPNCNAFGLLFDDTTLRQIYAASDLFIMPSLQESFGKVTIEAMAAGTPVVAFRNTPAEEMIVHGQTGWLVSHGDTEAFATTVDAAMMLGREKLALMGQTARAHALQNFALASVIDRHLVLYQEKLSE